MEYTELIYVNANNGDDINGDGSINSPFSTIEKAINSDTTTSPIIYLDKGIYPISILQNLSLVNKKITIKGRNLDTVIEVGKTTTTGYLGEMHICNLVIKPDDSFGGDTRVISYSNDNYKVTFNNVLFKENNGFPTASWFYVAANGSSYYNKDFYNCTFTGNLAVCKSGSVNIFNCALQYSDFGNVTTNEDSILNCEYDSNYNLINYDNSLYGIYSGEHAWKPFVYLLKQNNQYYTIKPEYYSNGQFQPLALEGGEQPNEIDYENFGFDDVNDLLISIQVGEETFTPYDKLDNEFEIYMATDKETI